MTIVLRATASSSISIERLFDEPFQTIQHLDVQIGSFQPLGGKCQDLWINIFDQ